MTDAEFDRAVELVAKREKDGLKIIYDAYAKRIYQVIYGIVKNPHDSQDLTADLFMKLWDDPSSYRSGNGHKRYLTVMAKNLALDFLRKAGRQSFEIDAGEKEYVIPDGGDVEKDITEKMSFTRALEYLNPNQRRVVDMHIGMEMTLREISEALDMPMGTVSWNYRSAIQKLKKIYKEGESYG